MWDFSFEYGMDTDSWYAEFALRNRVNMSAMGSVIVISGSGPSSSRFPARTCDVVVLPAALRHAGELTVQSHVPQAHAAQAELAVHRARPSALLAPAVVPDRELRLARGLLDQCGLRHLSTPCTGSRAGAAANGPRRRWSPW